MDDVQRVREALAVLKSKGWTTAAIADELSVDWDTVRGWETGRHPPQNPRLAVLGVERLLRRRRIPKKRRYKKNPPAT
jgi:DNA-binding transcriptional regulator YiaG